MKELLEKMIKIGGVKGVVAVKSDDGSRVESAGNAESVLDDISAFVGSCGDVISKLLKLSGFNNLKFYTSSNIYIIVPKDDIYIGLSVENQDNVDDVMNKVIEYTTEGAETAEKATITEEAQAQEPKEAEAAAEVGREKETVLSLSPNIKKFIESKVMQINYLIEEFSEGGTKDDWLQNVIYSLKTLDKEEKMSNALVEENDNVKLYLQNVSSDISENEISSISKGIIDELCKLAVRRYGTDQTKQKIQNVIKKITKSKVG